jgi:hypothetical protein
MDPYLETSHWWPTVHHGIINDLKAALNLQLRPRYFATVEERVYFSDEDDPGREGFRILEAETHEARLEVVDTVTKDVVTVIEVLSPSNKIVGSRGRASYEEQRVKVKGSQSPLVEIDLLRTGMGFFPRVGLPAHDYSVYLSRSGDRRRRTFVIPITLQKRLPSVPIPLRATQL